MQLSDKQKKIISSVLLNSRASVAQLARETGFRPHATRYSLDRLKSSRVLVPYLFVDVGRLGLSEHCTYFSYRCESNQEYRKLVDFFRRESGITVAAELAGEYQYTASFSSSSLTVIDDFMSKIARECRGEFLAKAVATRMRWSLFRPKFFSAHPAAIDHISFSAPQPREQAIGLDRTDQSILKELARPDLGSMAEIGRRLALPRTTIESRVQNMERKGVIAGYGFQLDTVACGIHAFRLLVCQKHGSDGLREEFFAYAAVHPNITAFVHCVGNWDYELSIRVETPTSVPLIVQDIYSRFHQQIVGIRLLCMLNRLKSCLFPFPEGLPEF